MSLELYIKLVADQGERLKRLQEQIKQHIK